MAFVQAKLTGVDLEAALAKFEKKVSDGVLFSGAAGMAAVIYAEVKLNASPPRIGRKTGNLAASIYQVYSPEKSPDGRKTYRVSWNRRKAPHGHLIEFGTSRAPAHPFIRPALDLIPKAIDEGVLRMRRRLLEIV